MKKQRLVFVFSPRGSQWQGMGRQLFIENPVFRDTIVACDKIIRQLLGWSLTEKYEANSMSDEEGRTSPEDHIETEITAFQLGMVELLRNEGILPDAVAGLSGGEFCAAYMAGALNLEDTLRLAGAVGLSIRDQLGQGRMFLVLLELPEVETMIQDSQLPLYITAVYSRKVVILSTTKDADDEVKALFDWKGIKYYPVPSAFAFHCPIMDSWKPVFFETLQYICPHKPVIPVYSSCTKGIVTTEFSMLHWWNVVREPAYFNETIQELLEEGYDTFLEISPHPTLIDSIKELASDPKKEVNTFPVMQKNEEDNMILEASLQKLRLLGVFPLT